MTVALDHILWAAPDLDAGSASFAALSGVTPVTGGTHPGFGTRNRLASLGNGVFFEVIAPDPAQAPYTSGRGAIFAALPHPRLITFAMQTTDPDALASAATAAGLMVDPRVAMHRTRPDGVRLDWTVTRFAHPGYPELIPFAIDWQGSPHPSTTTPEGCTLRSLTALHPNPAPLAAIYKAMGIDIPVMAALHPGLVAVLDTPNGAVCLLGSGSGI
jgi:hypothetical protein